jgi:hypothetical protein
MHVTRHAIMDNAHASNMFHRPGNFCPQAAFTITVSARMFGPVSLPDQLFLSPSRRNLAVLGALESWMAEQDCTKQGQDSDMNPSHTAENVPILRNLTKSGAPDSAAPTGVTLEPELQAHIGRQLRAVYDEVVNEPVPDRFVRLLEELEREQAERP